MGPFLVLDTDTSLEKVKLDPITSVNLPLLENTAALAKEKNQSGLWTVLGEWNHIQANTLFMVGME
jgi:hypothetical protein